MSDLMTEQQCDEVSACRKERDELFESVYKELKGYAKYMLFRGGRSITLSATVVVHEAWLKISVDSRLAWRDKSHFFRISAMAIRQIVVDEVRRKLSLKRGEGKMLQEFDEELHSNYNENNIVLTVNELIDELRAVDSLYCDVVECRYFAGYSEEETARILNLSVRTVQRYWAEARKLMRAALE